MTSLVFIAMPGNEVMAARLAALAQGELATLETRQFPDGESHLRLRTDVSNSQVAVVCTLDRPDGKFLPMVYAAAMARDLGAVRVGLVAPYLAYMRQDHRFKSGEAVTSTYFARLISNSFDWLVTVAPHLHRHTSLDEIYSIPSTVVHANAALSRWIQGNVADPLIVGPDAESAQWVTAIAADVPCPYAVLSKHRLGDREVDIAKPNMDIWRARQPILVDDIISSAATMIEAARLLAELGMPKPICVGIHGLFAERAYERLMKGVAHIATTNTVPHESNEIDLGPLIAGAVKCIAPRGYGVAGYPSDGSEDREQS